MASPILPDARDTIYFYGHQAGKPHAGFSNFFPCEFVHDGVHYTSSEQAMMHRKAVLFGDQPTADRILAEREPLACKRLGRAVTPFDTAVWAAERYATVKAILLDKFEQNPPLRAALLATGAAVLAEAAPREQIWGIGRGAAGAAEGKPWRGQNLLGKALMEVRAALRE